MIPYIGLLCSGAKIGTLLLNNSETFEIKTMAAITSVPIYALAKDLPSWIGLLIIYIESRTLKVT